MSARRRPRSSRPAIVRSRSRPHTSHHGISHSGDWKAVAKGPGGKWELYDLAKDRVEASDLAAKEPARLKELVSRWEA